MQRKRKQNAVKRLVAFNHADAMVKVWFDIKAREVCFRKIRSRKVLRIGVRELFDQLTGQIVMPFV